MKKTKERSAAEGGKTQGKSSLYKGELSFFKSMTGFLAFLWHSSPKTVLNILLLAPLGLCVSYMGIYLPKLVIWEIETGKRAEFFIASLVIYVLALALLNYGNERYKSKLKSREMVSYMEICLQYVSKILHVDYESFEKEAFQSLRIKAADFLFGWSGSMRSGWCERLYHTFLQLSGVLLYSVLIGRISGVLLVIVLISGIVNALCLYFPNAYEYKNWGKRAASGRVTEYITHKTADFALGKDVRLYGMTDWISREYEKYAGEWLSVKAKACQIAGLGMGAGRLSDVIRNMAAYVYLIYLVLKGDMATSDFVLYTGMVTVLSGYMCELINLAEHTFRMILQFGNMMCFSDLKEEKAEITDISKVVRPGEKITVTFDHVYYHFEGKEENVLKDICLTIREGEHLALVGENGAGKSTLIKLLCGLYRPSSGHIYMNGVDIQRIDRTEYFKMLSCVFQDMYFLPLSVGGNITMEKKEDRDLSRLAEAVKGAGIYEKIMSLPAGFETPLGKSVLDDAVDLSGGEKQKLMLARAVYKDAPMLILDEPTAALDPLAEEKIYQEYAKFSEGKTSLFISHRLSSTRFCDRILLMQAGTIREEGTHDELVKKGGVYAEMFRIQSHYYVENKKEGEEA